ncbi:MAG TPA: hypothetical protein VFE65_07060 [Pseudonocardia sp.]|nr:hypothetical protein [Pseudonocardia sp.]
MARMATRPWYLSGSAVLLWSCMETVSIALGAALGPVAWFVAAALLLGALAVLGREPDF